MSPGWASWLGEGARSADAVAFWAGGLGQGGARTLPSKRFTGRCSKPDCFLDPEQHPQTVACFQQSSLLDEVDPITLEKKTEMKRLHGEFNIM